MCGASFGWRESVLHISIVLSRFKNGTKIKENSPKGKPSERKNENFPSIFSAQIWRNLREALSIMADSPAPLPPPPTPDPQEPDGKPEDGEKGKPAMEVEECEAKSRGAGGKAVKVAKTAPVKTLGAWWTLGVFESGGNEHNPL